jgi:Hypothetical protein (DUF2513)
MDTAILPTSGFPLMRATQRKLIQPEGRFEGKYMKRDMELVREILLKVADTEKPIRFSALVTERKDWSVVAYHTQMLTDEVGFIRAINASSHSGKDWIDMHLTWHGHDFLDSVRDPTVWQKTKEGALKLGGVSLEVLVGIAKEYAKAEVKKRLGFDL